jgi:hypothetical protein
MFAINLLTKVFNRLAESARGAYSSQRTCVTSNATRCAYVPEWSIIPCPSLGYFHSSPSRGGFL